MRLFYWILIFVFLSLLSLFAFSSPEEPLKERIEAANFCKTDSDCAYADLPCPFMCTDYINKDRKEQLTTLAGDYVRAHGFCDQDCFLRVAPACIEGTCVRKICAHDTTYPNGKECDCPGDTLPLGYYNVGTMECLSKDRVFKRLEELDGQHPAEEIKALLQRILSELPDTISPEIFGTVAATGWMNMPQRDEISFCGFMEKFADYLKSAEKSASIIDDFNLFANLYRNPNP